MLIVTRLSAVNRLLTLALPPTHDYPAGLPPPARWFLSAMPPPDIPHEQRPWRVSAHLDEEAFKDECRGWDVNDVVFTAAMWPIYQPLMRADFAIFDQYVNDDDPADNGYYGDSAAADAAAAAAAATRAECSPQPAADGGHTICGLGGLGSNGSCSGVEAAHTSLLPDSSLTSVLSDKAAVAAETRLCPAKPVGAPITAFWARRDRRVTRDMVSGWRRFAAAGAPSFCGCGASCAAAASTDAADGGDYRSAASPPILSSSSASQFELLEVDGNHLFPLAPDAKRAWFGHITARLDSLVISRRR